MARGIWQSSFLPGAGTRQELIRFYITTFDLLY